MMTPETPFGEEQARLDPAEPAPTSGVNHGSDDRALFEQWRAQTRLADQAAGPDTLALAAWLERHASETEQAAIEAALSVDPALLDLVIELSPPITPEIPSAQLIRAAQAMIPVANSAEPVFSAEIIALSPRLPARTGRIGAFAAWATMAASLILVSLVGFSLGVRTEHSLVPATAHIPVNDLLDQTGLGDGQS